MFQKALDALDCGVTITDPEGTILYVNPVEAEMHGYTVEELLGRNVRLFSTARRWRVLSPEEIRQMKSWRRESVNRKKDRTLFPVELVSDAFTGPDGAVAGIITFCRDLTSSKVAEDIRKLEQEQIRRLQHEAFHDPLTGLTNRLLFMDRLTVAFHRARRRKSGLLALIYVDLDCFKEVNDSHGHKAGDEVLCTIAQRLESCLRPADTVGRLGGDEFGILLEDVNRNEDAVLVVQRIQAEIQRSVPLPESEIRVTASIGIAFPTRDSLTPEDLLNLADHAMYEAKNSGKARYSIAPVESFHILHASGRIQQN